MKLQKIGLAVLSVILIAGGVIAYRQHTENTCVWMKMGGEITCGTVVKINPDPAPLVPQTPSVFTGTLEAVNTACFADGECFAMVDGKKVTLLVGWSRETVGQVDHEGGIGGLEAMVGQTVEVHAHQVNENTYTLYGDEAYFVRRQYVKPAQ